MLSKAMSLLVPHRHRLDTLFPKAKAEGLEAVVVGQVPQAYMHSTRKEIGSVAS